MLTSYPFLPMILISALLSALYIPPLKCSFFWSELERFWCQLFKLSSCIVVNNLVGMFLKNLIALVVFYLTDSVLCLVVTPILCLTLEEVFWQKCIIQSTFFFSFRRDTSSGKVWNTACKTAFFLVCSGLSLSHTYFVYIITESLFYGKTIGFPGNHAYFLVCNMLAL